jgi:steroid delta-isomerase-like uncharacterized protein
MKPELSNLGMQPEAFGCGVRQRLMPTFGVSTLNTSGQALWRCPIMQNVIPEVTTETLQAFADAWNRHDVDALMSFMTEDCVFESSAGADACGTRYVGRQAVRTGYAEVWGIFPDAHWGNARHFVDADRGVSEWTFTGTRADGTRVEVHGCDLFTFRDGKIFLKNSYRKNRTPIA